MFNKSFYLYKKLLYMYRNNFFLMRTNLVKFLQTSIIVLIEQAQFLRVSYFTKQLIKKGVFLVNLALSFNPYLLLKPWDIVTASNLYRYSLWYNINKNIFPLQINARFKNSDRLLFIFNAFMSFRYWLSKRSEKKLLKIKKQILLNKKYYFSWIFRRLKKKSLQSPPIVPGYLQINYKLLMFILISFTNMKTKKVPSSTTI